MSSAGGCRSGEHQRRTRWGVDLLYIMHLEDLDLEQRLSRFEAQLDRFSVALHQWQQTQEQGQAVGAHGVDQQMQRFEVTLEREAEAFRRMLDEPLKQMQAHAASLREICATASYTVAGLDQVESRLAAVQADAVMLHDEETAIQLASIELATLNAPASCHDDRAVTVALAIAQARLKAPPVASSVIPPVEDGHGYTWR